MSRIRNRLGKFLQHVGVVGPTNAYEELLDDDRSQYPWDAASGYWSFGAGSAALTSMLLGQSGYWFKLETLVVNNDASIPQKVLVYDGNGSRAVIPMVVAASDTVFIQQKQLRGMFFVSGVFISGNSTLQARVGGKLLVSIPNGQI